MRKSSRMEFGLDLVGSKRPSEKVSSSFYHFCFDRSIVAHFVI